jgi:hypothetical protein
MTSLRQNYDVHWYNNCSAHVTIDANFYCPNLLMFLQEIGAFTPIGNEYETIIGFGGKL